ncbi:MAG: hypothetical protein ACXVCY_13860 [Pseudobdellovibrionaceae bacterium]
MKHFFSLLVFLSISLFISTYSLAAKVVTETVGQVGEYVVTSREVQISMVLENILYPAKTSPKGLYEIHPGGSEFRSDVTSVLLEVVVALEAENFNFGNLSEDELAAAILKIERAVAGHAYWNELEVSATELKKFTQRKLVEKSFLKFKTNSMTGIITDQEAQAYYDKNRVKFGTTPFASFKSNIKIYLAQQQLEERLRAWFEVLKRKYKVRNFISD